MMTTTTTEIYTVIDQTTYRHEHTAYHREVRNYAYVNGDGRHTYYKLRVDIARNFYDHQSYARIQKWSDTQGWLLIESHPITDVEAKKVQKVTGELNEADLLAFGDTAERLFLIGERFMGRSEFARPI
jgi:hypothetical protein